MIVPLKKWSVIELHTELSRRLIQGAPSGKRAPFFDVTASCFLRRGKLDGRMFHGLTLLKYTPFGAGPRASISTMRNNATWLLQADHAAGLKVTSLQLGQIAA